MAPATTPMYMDRKYPRHGTQESGNLLIWWPPPFGEYLTGLIWQKNFHSRSSGCVRRTVYERASLTAVTTSNLSTHLLQFSAAQGKIICNT